MANAHHGILVSIKKKQVIGPCKNLDGSQGHFQKVKHCIILFLLHCQKGTIIEIENKLWVPEFRDGRGKDGSYDNKEHDRDLSGDGIVLYFDAVVVTETWTCDTIT